MLLRWLETASPAEVDPFPAAFWQHHKDALASGDFWADRIRALRGEPAERLRLALSNLPLPGAFREAALTTRCLIREKRKLRADFEDELTFLYWLAAVWSFSVSYSEALREPGYNVMQSIPGKTVANLPFTYRDLGYEQLELLNKTDVKWIKEAWGEPGAHTTLHKLHFPVWQEFEERLRVTRQAERAKFTETIEALLS